MNVNILEQKLTEAIESERYWWCRAEKAEADIEQLRSELNYAKASEALYYDEGTQLREQVRALRYVLSRIFEAMPTKRDWLDPVLEKVALDATKEASQ